MYGGTEKFQEDPHWRDLVLFYEYFHGDNGAGLGASHQTGWTGLVAPLIQLFGHLDAAQTCSSEEDRRWPGRTAGSPGRRSPTSRRSARPEGCTREAAGEPARPRDLHVGVAGRAVGRAGAPVTLADVPADEWDAVAGAGVDAVWLMGVWERSPAGAAIAREPSRRWPRPSWRRCPT